MQGVPMIAADVVGQLSLEQKLTLMAGADVWHTARIDDPPVPAIRMSDGPAGVRGTSWTGPPSLSFPCGAALGATFDPALVAEIGGALARECIARGVNVLLGPTVNLARTPIGGRNFECFGEDPVLTAELAVAYIEGLQRFGVAACVKHFVANDTEFERLTVSVEADEETLRELYFVPFEAAVARAAVRCVMAAYNRLHGTFCSEHEWLLADVLRGDWGFDGVVMSDWHGCHSGAPSLRAGLDVEMPGPPVHRGAGLAEEIAAGAASPEDLDRAAGNIVRLAAWSTAGQATAGDVGHADTEAARALIRRAEVAAMVLLKNEGGLLPLGLTTPRLALIGPNAALGQTQGGGSAQVRPERVVGPLEALRRRGYDVSFEPGGFVGRTLPVLHADGTFAVELTDASGRSATITGTQLKWLWQQPPVGDDGGRLDGFDFGGRAHGTFVPDESGTWEIGALSVGASTLRIDGDVVVEIPAGESGGIFFGRAGPEQRTKIELEAGRPYDVELDYPYAPGDVFRGFSVGARHVPSGDPIGRAAEVAAGADAAVVIVGTDEYFETEGEDRTTLALPGEQDLLVSAVAAANPNTVVVLNSGSPVTMPWLDDVAAVIQLWFPGQELGDALADVLSGDAEPGGRLPVTFPCDLDDTPAAPYYPAVDGRSVYGERQLIGYRWFDRTGVEPLFPFGHGLGYTTFSISSAGISGAPGDGVTVTVDVTNTGERAGGEVVQVYVEPAEGDPLRPVRQLAGFRRVYLDPAATERIDIEVPRRPFEIWRDGTWVPAAGSFRLLVGRSSRDLTEAGATEV
jgi:beta-glucosidase